MSIKDILRENLCVTFYSLCLVVLAESSLMRLFGITAALCVGITAPIFVFGVLIVYLNRKTSTVYVGAAAIITLILWALSLAGISVPTFIGESVQRFFTGGELEAGQLFCVGAIISLLLSAVLFPLSRLAAVRYVTAGAAAALLIFYGVNGIVPDVTEAFAAAGMIITELTELYICLRYKKERTVALTPVVSFLVPLFAVIALITAVLPSSSEPIRWEGVKRVASGIADFCVNLASDIDFMLHPERAEFGIGMQGYTDAEGVFGAGLFSDGQEQLTLSYLSRPCGSIYLIGNTNAEYTGKGWVRGNAESFSEEEYYLDYCEAVVAFERMGYTSSEVFGFTARSSVNVEYRGDPTRTLFYPIKTTKIASPFAYDAKTSSVVIDGKSSKGLIYSVNYMEIDYRSELFENAARSAYSSAEPYTGKNYLDSDIPYDIAQTLAERAERIRRDYLPLPDCVTARTRELAARLTEGCDNDYDKLCALEGYLRGYTYTTEPGAVPTGADPVDYFLFESRAGYCTYFASAMTILARCAGIPARYVQGYAVEINAQTDFKSISVTNTNAHAWSEAYIEGIGWVPLEATAPFAGSRYGFRERTFVPSGDFNYSDYYNRYEQENVGGELPTDEKGSEDSFAYVPIIAVTLLGIVLIALLLIAVRLRVFAAAYRKSSETVRFLICYRLMLHILGKRKLIRETGETADCFTARAAELYPESALCDINRSFDSIRYGGAEADAASLKTAEGFIKQMFAEMREKQGRAAAVTTFVGFCLSRE